MTTKIKFTKMHGAGNDYIYVDTSQYPIADPAKKAIEWSKFHTGIGSDGLILIGVSDKADFSMRIFNADGSEAMMCGNGSRCVGKYVYEYGLTDKTEITLDTRSGIKILKLHVEGKTVSAVTVDMGSPLETEEIQWGGKYPFRSTKVSMGNPHLVTFVEDITRINLPEIDTSPPRPVRARPKHPRCTIPRDRGSGTSSTPGAGRAPERREPALPRTAPAATNAPPCFPAGPPPSRRSARWISTTRLP